MDTIVFVFSGQGSQYYRMGAGLYFHNERFRQRMDRMDKICQDMLQTSIVNLLYFQGRRKKDDFRRTRYTHPAVFMVQYALAKTLMEDYITPDCLVGVSLGEYVALALSGVLPAEKVLRLILRHGTEVEETCRPGRMVCILENPRLFNDVPMIHENSSLAGINFDRHFVISGFQAPVSMICEWLRQHRKLALELPVTHGFHSPNIDPSMPCLIRHMAPGAIERCRIPLISCVTGQPLESPEPIHFQQIVRKRIRFRKAMDTLFTDASRRYHLIDAGPSGTYTGFVRQNPQYLSRDLKLYQIMTPFGGEKENYEKVTARLARKPSRRSGHKEPDMKAYLFSGQGSQHKGMGKDLFDLFPDHMATADEVLGYSIKALCLDNPDGRLNQTRFTQPALFVVNALSFLKRVDQTEERPDYVAGHSLGEYNALFAANVFDFKTGLCLVVKRGELMAQTKNGGMAAVIGLSTETIRQIIDESGFTRIQIANLNSPTQTVISGDMEQIRSAKPVFEKQPGTRYSILNVSGPFHSDLMTDARNAFETFLDRFTFSSPRIPVVSNVLARPYPENGMKKLLARQLTDPVRWIESVLFMREKGVTDFLEIGPGNALKGLTKAIIDDARVINTPHPDIDRAFDIIPTSLGSRDFKKAYGLKYAYATGGMAWGIASEALVVKMGKARMLAYFGTGGLTPDRVEKAIICIQNQLKNGEPYGMNLISGSGESELVHLFIKYRVPNVEASGYTGMSESLVKYRLKGLVREPDGTIAVRHRIMGKLSRPEVASVFLSPAPEAMVEKLYKQGELTREQAAMARQIPMADDICVEADSGGHTDMGTVAVLMPAIIHLRDETARTYGYVQKIRIGSAGGIGSPEAAASAFMMGADFILTGSINQCTVEAGTSPLVKNLLQEMNVQDTAYVPSGDLFEMGTKTQVLKRGVFFPARANKLYELYRHYESLEQIDEDTRHQLENNYFKRSFNDVFNACKQRFATSDIQRATNNPKSKMALVFRWYIYRAVRLALLGREENQADFQVFCGPSLGAFNRWVKGSPLANWQNRHVDQIGEKLMLETATFLKDRINQLAVAD